MSDIRANTISDAAGTGPIDLYKQSAAKAWVNFNGTGTIAVRDSFNVASLADSGVGDYTVNFTSSMNNSDYAPAHGNPDTGAIFYNTQTGGQTVSGTRIRSLVTSTVAATDPLGVGLSIQGDLA